MNKKLIAAVASIFGFGSGAVVGPNIDKDMLKKLVHSHDDVFQSHVTTHHQIPSLVPQCTVRIHVDEQFMRHYCGKIQ